MKKIVGLIFFSLSLNANVAVVGDEYHKISNEKLEIIYTKEHQKEAESAKLIIQEILKDYEKSYGFSLDDKLYLGLLSSKNQIPNAFSTQFPLNMQMNYIGGAYMVDYMSTTSWLKTLLIHEGAHNFQLNPKKNPLSRVAHKVLKNSPFTMLFFIPIFPVPNILETSFMLEGNAVLNESRFGNGGRLYNGALLAMAITQARAGFITPERTYNDHLYFPYSTHNYIIGGFFQLYLSEKYGVDKVNNYFYNYSGQYIPIQTNAIFEETFGKNYESEIANYSTWLQNKYNGFKVSDGEVIVTSKSHKKLNSTSNEILFFTSDALSKPLMHRFIKDDSKDYSKKVDYPFGEIFKVGDDYFSSTSRSTAVDEISLGLFDEDGKILKSTKSKIVQGILKSGGFVYFDVATSFEQPHLYVKDKFYDIVNSSVYVDGEDNLYYFKQDKKRRTLYKNREPILSFEGWYGFVTDVNDEGILFVANSKNGSSSYIFNGSIFRASDGDDIVDAKFIDSKTLLLTTIKPAGYSYIKAPIKKSPSQVFNREYFFEKEAAFSLEIKDINSSENFEPYSSYKDIHFSSLSQSVVIKEDGIDFSLGANFADPLGQNSLSAFVSSYDDETFAGVGYTNSQYRLEYGANIYGVLEDTNSSNRDFGANIFANYPLYKEGYTRIDARATYHIDHEVDEREPLSLSLNLINSRYYGKSMYPNLLNKLSIFAVIDRDDMIGGFEFNYFRDFSNQFYGGVGVKYAKSDINNVGERRGVNIDDNSFSLFNDPSHFEMPTLKGDIYVKEAVKGSLSLYKVFDLDFYSFTLPVSLRRESVYAKYNYYDLTFVNDVQADFNEYILGGSFDLLFLHKLAIPISIEYLYNDNLRDPESFRISFDLPL